MNRHSALIAFLLFVLSGLNPINAQSTFHKVGGVAFRVDDQQAVSKWRDFNKVFQKYGYHYSLGIDIQRVTFDTSSVNALKEAVANGNELMDHTPYGTTCYLWVYNLADTIGFFQHPAVDHINKNRICLKFDSILINNVTGEGLVDLIGDKLISRAAGEFKNMYSPAYSSNIYLPGKKLLCAWYNLENKNSLDPDTMALRTYWQETFPLDTVYGIAHHRLSGYDIKLTDAAQNLLIERSLYLFDSSSFPRPYTWLQPGGSFTQFNATEVKAKMGLQYGYTAAATYVSPSYKMYNETDSLKIKRFALQNPDFSDESSYFQGMINTIADNSARHVSSFSLGHFVNPVGGWNAYLGRIDSLLAWCRDNNIPVRTVNQWASILFDSVPDPFTNAIPELYRDLNNNGIPDGMSAPFGTFDTTDGVSRSRNRSIARTGSGNYFGVNIMGGVEKGWNRISAFTKGMAGDSIRIYINFPELPGSSKFYNLASNTSSWKEVSMLIYIDPRASRVNMQFNANKNNIAGTMKLSGMQLRKQSFIRVDPNFTHQTNVYKPFNILGSGNYVNDSAYNTIEYRISLLTAPKYLTISIDTVTNMLTAVKPSIFWFGKDSVKVRGINADKTSDSAYLHFESTQPVICIGDSVYIKADATFGSNFNWFGQVAGNGFWTKPIQNTWYVLQYKNKLNQNVRDSLQVIVNLVKPQINLVNDTSICLGNPLLLNLTNNGNINWFNEAGIKIKAGATIVFNNLTLSKKIFVSNTINSCMLWDTLQIHINPLKRLSTKVISDTTKMNLPKSFIIFDAAGLNGYLLNIPANKFSFTNGTVMFDPNLNFTGRDSARFHITDGSCSNDTIWVKVNVFNTLSLDQTDELKNFLVYPNPAVKFITIQNKINASIKILIVDLSGRIVISKDNVKMNENFDISELTAGMYYLLISCAAGDKRMLLIKQ